jgi:hypothetical protein
VNPTAEADASSHGVLVVRALGMEHPAGSWSYRVSWLVDGEQVSYATMRAAELHDLVDVWLDGLGSPSGWPHAHDLG